MNIGKIVKTVAKKVTPRVVQRKAKTVIHLFYRKGDQEEKWGVKDSRWYDSVYDEIREYRKHYTDSMYYFLWTVIADRVIHADVQSVLELGCGPGQLAALLRDKGLRRYCGLDFSSKCIELAKPRCPNFSFIVADIYQTDLLETCDYDCIIATEFLEHIEKDIEVITRIKPGIKFLASVPNFPYISHVRNFTDKDEVYSRYQKYFSEFHIDSFLADAKGKKYYLIDGIK